MLITAAKLQSAKKRKKIAHAGQFFSRASVVVAAAFVAACSATDSTHPLRGAATTVGWATQTGEPKDFVLARRSKTELAYVPVGREAAVRPIAVRSAAGARDLEAELDSTRDRSEAFARRQLPAGAYGQPLPSLAAPARTSARPGLPERPTAGAPESFPVNPNRLRQLRENSRQVTE
ncbi:MAG: hypothetical protein ACRCWF_18120 [Beijerinckiaceae bacterium]